LLFVALVLIPTAALAQTRTLNNGSPNPCGGCWSFGQWTPGGAPQTGEDVVLNASSPQPNNYDLNVTLHSLTLNSNIAAPNGYTITTSTGAIGLQSGGFITDSNNAGGLDAINTGVTLNGPAGATFTLSAGAIGLSFGTNAVTGTGPLTLVNNSTDDALRLNVANSYTGATTVGGTGRVRADVNGAIPTGSALTVNGSVLFQAGSTLGSLAGGGTVAMNGSNTLTAGGDNTSTTFSGVYQDSGGAAALTKSGAGTLVLGGANTYTGATTVNAGTLLVNGSLAAASAVTVNNAAMLGGTGTVNAVTVNGGGALAPGGSPGIINTGNLTLTAASTLAIEINGATVGTQYDQVNVTGTVNLGGATLSVTLGFVPAAGTVFTIVNNDGADAVTGTFAGLAEGATFTVGGTQFRISYVGSNDVTLTAVETQAIPTLSEWAQLGMIAILLVGGLLALRRRSLRLRPS
jgi:autotransporter-associated beta strand protein